MTEMRVALAHDTLLQAGGAERVLQALMELFPTAPVATTVFDPGITKGMGVADVRATFLQRLPAVKAVPPVLALALPLAADRLVIRNVDLLVSSSSSVAHGARAPDGIHVSYVHNTMRYAWDYDQYMSDVAVATQLRGVGSVMAKHLRAWDVRSVPRADYIIANSNTVAERIRARWHTEVSAVIYPPVDVDAHQVSHARREGLLVITRLVAYKRVDLAVRAANLLGLPLSVIGEGPDRRRLESMAGPTVRFHGRVSEDVKTRMLGRAAAVVVPGEEDFGIVPVEANACGTPVVALGRGGVTESQIPGVTAVFAVDTSLEALVEAIRAFPSIAWDRERIRKQALRFSDRRFQAEVSDFLGGIMRCGRRGGRL